MAGWNRVHIPSSTAADVIMHRPETMETFARHGWTTREWTDLYEFARTPTTGPAVDGRAELAMWLVLPPERFKVPISPAMVKKLFARRGRQTGQVLTAIAAGASERFAVVFLGSRWLRAEYVDAVNGWQNACAAGLSEAQATGWADTEYLHREAWAQRTTKTLIANWTTRFGPAAYLWVLAGFTLAEADALNEAGTTISEEQLRVMAVLSGATLPAGI